MLSEFFLESKTMTQNSTFYLAIILLSHVFSKRYSDSLKKTPQPYATSYKLKFTNLNYLKNAGFIVFLLEQKRVKINGTKGLPKST